MRCASIGAAVFSADLEQRECRRGRVRTEPDVHVLEGEGCPELRGCEESRDAGVVQRQRVDLTTQRNTHTHGGGGGGGCVGTVATWGPSAGERVRRWQSRAR